MSHWRHLANTIESSVCDGDAAFLSNYSEHLLSLIEHSVIADELVFERACVSSGPTAVQCVGHQSVFNRRT